MRKLGSYLVILIFLTAYGRCVADQLGILHTSGTACCQTVCEEVIDSCDHCPETGNLAPGKTSPPANDDDQQSPAPCQLCFILDSDSMLIGESVKVPPPIIQEMTDHRGLGQATGRFLHLLHDFPDQDLMSADQPDPPAEPRLSLQRISTKTTPVRGPSFA